MTQFTVYKNYGALTAEKRAVYSVGCPSATAKCYDKLTVEAPAGWDIWESESGELGATTPDGLNYPVRDILCGDERPMLRIWTPDGGDTFAMLHICNVEER